MPPHPSTATGARKTITNLDTAPILPKILDNPFKPGSASKEISLSVYNRPMDMVNRRPRTAKTTTELVQLLPGYKPPKPKDEIGPDGEVIPPPPTEPVRDPILPNFNTPFEMISKDAADYMRQKDYEELLSIKERLA